MRRFLLTAIALCAVFSSNGYADNFTVDKVYHPYVLPFEREFEWRLTSRQNDDGNVLMQRLSIRFDISIGLDFLKDFKLAQIFDKSRVSDGNTLAILTKHLTIRCTILK